MSLYQIPIAICTLMLLGGCTSAPAVNTETKTSAAETTDVPDAATADSTDAAEEEEIEPWDYSPYRVMVWVVSDDPAVNAASLDQPLRTYLNRDFGALWRVNIADAPMSARTAAKRDLAGVNYDTIVDSDPILAIKRDHKDAVRIRIPANVAAYVKKVYATPGQIEDVKQRAAEFGDETLGGVLPKLEAVSGDAISLREMWKDESTEALLVTRGLALTLTEPEAKLVTLPISNLVSTAIDGFDKIFIVHIDRSRVPNKIRVVEFETLMRFFGPVVTEHFVDAGELPNAVGRALTKAFSPLLRIDDAGQKTATGILRAGGLIMKTDSPGLVKVDDVLQPMIRKDDRNGRPIMIGPIEWAYLVVESVEGVQANMGYYSGRPGGLQGRQNKRTFRMAMKVSPVSESTMIRLHAQKREDFPLIGYEIYEKELQSTKMTFVGRTDWDGRLHVQQADHPLRLLYVKNGGAVLARLPLVPGLTPVEVADLTGDDLRLEAEAYIRGVENAIVDLVALRKLLAARVRLHLYSGDMTRAEELVNVLREQPSNEKLAADMQKKQSAFLKAIGTRNANQRRKVDNMFTSTREMLSKLITPKDLRELEADVVTARKNGGKLARPEADPDAVDKNANDASAAEQNENGSPPPTTP